MLPQTLMILLLLLIDSVKLLFGYETDILGLKGVIIIISLCHAHILMKS